MSKPEESGFGGKTNPAIVNPKPNPGGKPHDQTMGSWVERDRAWKENGGFTPPKYL
jgi:hypothetical protein